MSIKDYQDSILSLRSYTENRGIYPAIKLFSESGEVADEVAKIIRYGLSDERKSELAKELGDVLGSLTYVANDYGYSLQDIAEIHLKKIKDRIVNDKHKPFEKLNTDGFQ